MKVAVIDPWCFTPPYDRELCDGLASIGHEVTLIGQDSGEFEPRATGSPLRFMFLGLFTPPADSLSRRLALILKGFRHVQGMLRSLRTLRRIRPDVIHVQWLALPMIDAIFIPLLRRIAPVVLTVHDTNPYNGAGPLLLRFGHTLAIRRFDRWIVHNEVSARHLADRGLEMGSVHQVAHGLLGPAVEGASVGLDEKQDGDRLTFLQFGKIKEYKGADVLLQAVGRLSDAQRRRCHVSIVGRPYIDTQPMLDLLSRHHLQDVVDLRFDFVSDEEMATLFDQADVLVFPYRDIDTSGVLMAALARAIPVVASNIGCFAEMLLDGREGRLVPADDPEALAGALASLIENPAQVNAMRTQMAVLQRRIPSWRRIAETTSEVYELAQASPTPAPVRAHT